MAAVTTFLILIFSVAIHADNFQICGEQLSDILTLVCNGAFNKRSGENVKRSFGDRLKRTTGVVQECCYAEGGCSIQTLLLYCANDNSDVGSLLQLVGAYADPVRTQSAGERQHGSNDQTSSNNVPNGNSNMTATQPPTEQIFRIGNQVVQQGVQHILQRPRFRQRISFPGQQESQNGRKWFFLPLALGPNPTRRPFERS